jgi:hypothetical protein
MSAQYEYTPLYLPLGTGRDEARQVMTVHAQFGGWELFQTRLYPDGRRRVMLRRKITGQPMPPLPT